MTSTTVSQPESGKRRMKYQIRFLTPAFLGDAGQSGEWRTPPFKALLREWWRIVKAPEVNYDHTRLREEEGRLFGHAWLKHGNEHWSSRAQVQIYLGKWRAGSMRNWSEKKQNVKHPEVKFPVDAAL